MTQPTGNLGIKKIMKKISHTVVLPYSFMQLDQTPQQQMYSFMQLD